MGVVTINFIEVGSLLFEVTKKFRNFSEKKNILRKMYQGGSSRKQGPRLAMPNADDEPPRDAPVRPCEWPLEDFMDQAGIKEEFNAYLHNADLVSFEAEKCRQYHYLTSSFVRRFEFSSSCNSPTVLFDLYENLILWT